MAVVKVSVAPVLAARSMRSEQVTQALLGAPTLVLERSSRWARIRMEDGYEGWVSSRHLAPDLPPVAHWVTITDLWVNLRTRPDYRMPARVVAFIGTHLPLADRRSGWLGLSLPGGGAGWLEESRARVHTTRMAPSLSGPEAILTTAQRFVGVPYLWGGCSPLGLDCSGFVQLVYRLHGVMLCRDAHQQASEGRPVPLGAKAPLDLSRLAPGDAVFFHADRRPERISHVGLSLGGEEFIHAAGGDRVRIDSWARSPYSPRFVCARRYLPDPGPAGA